MGIRYGLKFELVQKWLHSDALWSAGSDLTSLMFYLTLITINTSRTYRHINSNCLAFFETQV